MPIDIARRLVEGALGLFDTLPPTLALTLVGLATGVLLLFVVRSTTPQRWVERARARMASAIYETRLFLDSPRRVLIAQGRLIAWSLIYVATMLPAFVLVALPLGLAYLHLDARHGLLPVPVGEPFLVRVVLAPEAQSGPATLTLDPLPVGLRAAGTPAFVLARRTFYVPLRMETPGSYTLGLRAGTEHAEKRISGSPGEPIAPERTRGAALLFSPGVEPALPGSSVFASIAIAHEARRDTWLGMPWWLYWLLTATLAALLLKRPLGVTL